MHRGPFVWIHPNQLNRCGLRPPFGSGRIACLSNGDRRWPHRVSESTPTTRAPTPTSPTSGCSNLRSDTASSLNGCPIRCASPNSWARWKNARRISGARCATPTPIWTRRYANAQGLTMKGQKRIYDAFYASAGMLFTQRHRLFRSYHDTVFPRFWNHDLEIDDLSDISGVIASVGGSADD